MSVERREIELLEQTKDSIAAYLLGLKNLDEPTRGMWISDAKAVYFSVVAAHDILLGTKREEERHINSSRAFLASARSHMEQCSSELKALGDERGMQLDSELRERFEECVEAISAAIETLSPKSESSPPTKGVIRISESEYALQCSVCGKVAATFKVGSRWPSSSKSEMALLYEGTTKSTQLSLEDSGSIFEDLKSERISAANSFLEGRMEGGLDAYCPSCDKVYCREDYNVEEEWDAGYYDCSYGTCPEGHRRLIDD